MRSFTLPMLALALSLPLLGTLGCDRTVESTEKQTSGPNGSSVEKKTVTQDANGNVTVQKEKSDSTHNP